MDWAKFTENEQKQRKSVKSHKTLNLHNSVEKTKCKKK